MMGFLRKSSQKLLIGFVKAYQYLIRPIMGNHCRFYPSCSQYAIESIQTQGPLTGLFLILKRLGKCHPWHPGGVDQVPEIPFARLNNRVETKEENKVLYKVSN